jgi:outer membrane biosynthesis protein TonB
MKTSTDGPRRDRIAIASSIAAHLCVLGFVLAAEPVSDPGRGIAHESLAAVPILRLERRATPPPPRPLPPPHRVERPHVAATAPPTRIIRSFRTAAKAPVTAHAPIAAPDPDRIALQTAKTAAEARVAVVPTPAPTPPPTPEPTPPPTPQPTADHGNGGLFGQNYHAIPNPPEALKALVASVAQHLRLRIHVDERGKATAVDFLTPIADAAAADALRAQILALTYVPADCNGLRCADELEVRY